MRKFAAFVILVLAAAGAVYIAAGRMGGPPIEIVSPGRFIGTSTPLTITIGEPLATVSDVSVAVEQDGKRTIVASSSGEGGLGLSADGAQRVTVRGQVGPSNVPGLRSGPARIIVTASRAVLRGLRRNASEVTREVEVRLEQPRITVLSTHHYVNLGGSEAIVYRVSPADVTSGVVVGDLEYPGFPATGVRGPGVPPITDPAIRVAFFALRWDQALDTPMRVFARDEAGNRATADFEHRTFPKPQKQSRIQLDDRFLGRVIPAILAGTTDVKPGGSLIEQFVVVNGELRQKNAARIASFAASTSPEMLWAGEVFHPYTNSAAEAAFADHRTYIYEGREVDRQVHLGFDLASYANTPIVAANRGVVLFAAELGIYGNAVIIDHGMGLQSLYGHLSTIEVQPGAAVEKGQEIGRSGMTGMAGGDHLHFTMLLNGQMVTPVEWWDQHWIDDRILRKLRLEP
jgi:murein DD-endopeptidase MepM/ murein hydrolase activator NlpD